MGLFAGEHGLICERVIVLVQLRVSIRVCIRADRQNGNIWCVCMQRYQG